LAEFLIMAKRHWSYKDSMTTEEQTEYNRQYQIGDIVQVFPDGKLSDYANAGGKFFLVRVLGLTFEDALQFQEQWNEDVVVNNETCLRIKKRRKFNVLVENLPAKIKNKLNSTFVYDLEWNDIKSFIYNKILGTTVG